MKCIACDNTNSEFFMNKNNHDLFKCANCGLMFVFPMPTDLSRIYSEDYFSGAKQGFGYANYDADKKPMLGAWTKYLDIIEKHISRKVRLLDIGAATGNFIDLAKDRGWRAKGVEISDFAASCARENGLDVITGTLDDIAHERETFDAVCMWDVVEHLSDPLKSFKQVHELLKKDGVVAINTPDNSSVLAKILGKKWHLIVPPEHLHYFNLNSIARTLSKTGFEVVDHRRIGKTFTLYYIIRFIENRLNLPQFIGNQIAKNRFLSKISIPINTRDNMFVLAKKI